MSLTGNEVLHVDGVDSAGRASAFPVKTTTGEIAALAILPSVASLPCVSYSQVSGVGAVTLSAGDVTGGTSEVDVIFTGAQTAEFTATLPDAASWISAIKNVAAGQIYKLRILNPSAHALTLVSGAGVAAEGTLTFDTETWREFVVTVANVTKGSEALTLLPIGGGTYS